MMKKPHTNSLISQLALTTIMVVCLFLYPDKARGEEQQETPVEQEENDKFMNFVDRYHTYLLNRVNKPAIWFDNFFGDPRTDDEDLPKSFVRLRLSSRYTEGEGFEFPVRIRANLKLPRASRKLRLIVVGQSEQEFQKAKNRDDPSNIGDEELKAEGSGVGLRYTLFKTVRSKLHFGGGVNNLSPLEYLGRVAWRRLIHVGKKNIIRLKQTGFWHSEDGYGETSRIDLERVLAHQLTGRLSLHGTYYDNDPDTEKNNGLNWGIETNLFKRITPKTAVSFDLATHGVTRPEREVTDYRIASRIRTNTLRPWLFFEVEPQVTFPLSEITEERQAVGAITVVMEIQFAGT